MFADKWAGVHWQPVCVTYICTSVTYVWSFRGLHVFVHMNHDIHVKIYAFGWQHHCQFTSATYHKLAILDAYNPSLKITHTFVKHDKDLRWRRTFWSYWDLCLTFVTVFQITTEWTQYMFPSSSSRLFKQLYVDSNDVSWQYSVSQMY